MTMSAKQRDDQDVHKGVVEGDRPGDEQYWNANVPALNANGLPRNLRAIAEDRIGANFDYGDAANADERGGTSDALRLELSALA